MREVFYQTLAGSWPLLIPVLAFTAPLLVIGFLAWLVISTAKGVGKGESARREAARDRELEAELARIRQGLKSGE